MLTLPADGLTLEDKQGINKALLNSGANIGEMNCVRKHLSRIKGGRLAAACAPARVVTLTISDVPGDAPSIIASGPTVPDATTCVDALAILVEADRARRADVARAAAQFLERGLDGGGRGGLDGVCDREEAYEPAIGSHVDDGGSVAAQLIGTVLEVGGVDVVGVEEVGAAEDQDLSFDGAYDAAADW